MKLYVEFFLLFAFLYINFIYLLVYFQILLNSEFSFKMGTKVFDFLLDMFLFHNFSVVNFILAFKVLFKSNYLQPCFNFQCFSYNLIYISVCIFVYLRHFSICTLYILLLSSLSLSSPPGAASFLLLLL